MKKKVRAAAYGRVSTEKDDQVNSLISQREYFSDYIRQHEEWELTGIYYDEGISGTQTANRRGFNRMIQDAIAGKIDLILTKEVSRFARNTVDTLSYIRKLKEKGVRVIFTIDNIDTMDGDGELRLSIMATLAQDESRKTSERVKWGQKRRMEQGVVFGRDLLGYTVKAGNLFVNEEETGIVKAIFHKYTNEQKGTHVIARELTEEGIPPKQGERWSNTMILKVLKNEKYAGDLCQKKTITPDFLSHRKKRNEGEEEMVYLKNHHTPVIDRELWDRTQRELKVRSSSQQKVAGQCSHYWCSGKVKCGECGGSFVIRTKKRSDGSIYKSWRCYNHANHGNSCCQNTAVSDLALRACVSYAVKQVKIEKDTIAAELLQSIKRLKRTELYTYDDSFIEKRIGEIQSKKKKCVDLALEGILNAKELAEQKDWYDGQIKRLERRLLKIEKEKEIEEKESKCPEKYIKTINDILRFQEKEDVLYREILDKAVVYPGQIVCVWLKDLPFGIKMQIQTSGKRENYTTEILDVCLVKKNMNNDMLVEM